MSLLTIDHLSIDYATPGETPVHAVKDANFTIEQGEFVGLVGESGSGKSTLGFAITRLSPPSAVIAGGRVLFDGKDITTLSAEQL